MILTIKIRDSGANGCVVIVTSSLFLFPVARRKLDQIENGSYDKEVSSMGSRSSSSGKKPRFSYLVTVKKSSFLCVKKC